MKSLRSSTPEKPSNKHKHVDDHKVDHEEDGISLLPEPILHDILSLLSTKDALKTSVLSKMWNSASTSLPVLDFNQKYFYESRGGYKPHKKRVKDFCYYVDNAIARRCCTEVIRIQKFKLVVYFKRSSSTRRGKDLYRWLNYAVSNNVEHLVFHHKSSKDGWPLYSLPTSTLFRANVSKSLKELDLYGCKFVDGSNIGQLQFSLKKLRLERVDIDDQALQSLLSNRSSSLEELSIRHCDGFQSVNVSSAKLESVDLHLGRKPCRVQQKIAIDEAPNLRFLSYAGDYWSILSSLEASNFNKNNVIEELRFSGTVVNNAIFQLIIREFLVLDKVELIGCVVDNIRISSRSFIIPLSDSAKNVEVLVTYCQLTDEDGEMRSMPHGLYTLGIE